jgi:AcrR family transcriptional regulator
MHDPTGPPIRTPARRPRNAAKAKADLLDVATEIFARHGYYGARVDDIADKSTTTKRMIYYYFGDKNGLFTAVLERAYANVRAAETALHLADLPPIDALTALVRHTFRWHAAHPEVARLVAAENAVEAEHLRHSPQHHDANLPVVTMIDDILQRGLADGIFVRKASPLELHLHMSALALFQITNSPSIAATFDVNLLDPATVDNAATDLASMITTWLCNPDPEPTD